MAAILALTSIVFSQFNERSIQKSNDIARGIRNRINSDKESLKSDMVKEDFDHMMYLLSNTSIYNKTMMLFKIVSYFILILWWFSLVGYLNDAETIADKVMIFLSVVLISIPFLYLPDILKLFNKNQPLILNNQGQITINEVISFFKKNTSLKDIDVIKEFLRPNVEVALNHNKINLEYNINVNVTDFTAVFVVENEEQRIITNISRGINNTNKSFYLSPIGKEIMTNDSGLFSLFKKMIGKEATIYICKSSIDYLSFKGEIKIIDSKIQISLINKNNKTLDSSMYNYKNQLIVHPNLGEPISYDLKAE
nr:hypothetical protein [Lysinibacillus timonensis]